MSVSHIPVLLKEVLQYLDPKPGENFIDCTVGQGGHAFAILERLMPGGKLLGIDTDAESLERLARDPRAHKAGEDLVLVNGNFADIGYIAREHAFEAADGILMDLGWSSWQLEESGRGLSFLRDEPLDMRLSPNQQLTAAHIVNMYPEKTLAEIFESFGQERFSRQIAKAIAERRKKSKILRSKELADVVVSGIPRKFCHGNLHAATRVFQALRIVTNNELENLQKSLEGALSVLRSGGRLAVISFHSLEDRIVKNFIREQGKLGVLTPLTANPLTPLPDEIQQNPRSRSAKLRAAIKTNSI